jgi:hypothetical protein
MLNWKMLHDAMQEDRLRRLLRDMPEDKLREIIREERPGFHITKREQVVRGVQDVLPVARPVRMSGGFHND